jgi:phosphatidylglycerophosphate synthase
MTIAPRGVVNSLSLSRVGLGLLFVLCFQRNAVLFDLSLAFCLVALVTDLLDGYLARKFEIASVRGRLWDSLGDKSFYVAIIIAFNGQGFLGPLVSWALIVREVTLYITRILFIERLPQIEKIRPWTNWHGYFMYLTIILGLLQMYAAISGRPVPLSPYVQVTAYSALACGIASIVSFLRIQ